MKQEKIKAHLLALMTVLVWGTTFISTKVLLHDFTPVEILLYRFVIGYVMMLLLKPRILPVRNVREELTFAAAGLTGLALYYLLENIALTYTLASNVGVIVSIAPIFTAILARFIWKEERLRFHFFLGFAVAMVGIGLISFGGGGVQFNPIGDILCILAAVSWAVYSVLCKRISGFGYPTILTTRRIFFYGILFMLPCAFLMDFHFGFDRFLNWVNGGNFLFLGIGASAICFMTWNWSVGVLGAVSISAYIYIVPVVTVVTAALVLHEPITIYSATGTALALAGLFLSEWRARPRRLEGQAYETGE